MDYLPFFVCLFNLQIQVTAFHEKCYFETKGWTETKGWMLCGCATPEKPQSEVFRLDNVGKKSGWGHCTG